MKSLWNDESGIAQILEAWVMIIFGLFIIGVAVILILPINNYIANTMVELGAPLTTTSWIQRAAAWSLGVMGVGLIIYGVSYAYKNEFDQGYTGPGRYY